MQRYHISAFFLNQMKANFSLMCSFCFLGLFMSIRSSGLYKEHEFMVVMVTIAGSISFPLDIVTALEVGTAALPAKVQQEGLCSLTPS